MSQYATEIKDFITWCCEQFELRYRDVFVDPACKSLREELHLLGIQTMKADNNAKDARKSGGGIEVGIERCQNAIQEGYFNIVETEKYGHYDFIKEIGMYARDKNGKPIDDWNHSMDEFRYSINYFYKNYLV